MVLRVFKILVWYTNFDIYIYILSPISSDPDVISKNADVISKIAELPSKINDSFDVKSAIELNCQIFKANISKPKFENLIDQNLKLDNLVNQENHFSKIFKNEIQKHYK